MIPREEILGLVLAGGRSRRFGWEKAVVIVNGVSLIARAVGNLAAEVASVAINAPAGSGAADFARTSGLILVSDPDGLPDGPLTGVLAGLRQARAQGCRWLATVPCDLPFLSTGLVSALAASSSQTGARVEGPTGRQPLCALWSVDLEPWLAERLSRGHPPVHALQDEAGFHTAWFDDVARFANFNSPQGLEARRAAWALTPVGPPFATLTSWLQPVSHDGARAMLKIATTPEERRGGAVLAWFDGRGAARVLRRDEDAVLVEWLADDQPLTALAAAGPDGDSAACDVLCDVIARLHADQPAAPREVAPLTDRFAALERLAHSRPVMGRAWAVAERLLTENREPRVLHGDIHHENVLHDPARGWRAIDPKGLIGPRGYDYANLLRNPLTPLARDQDRLLRLAGRVSQRAGLPLAEVLGWTLAHAGLSAAWSVEDAETPDHSLAVAEAAAALLG